MSRKLRIAFILNPLEEMRHWDDTSFSIMAECERRGHSIYFLESKDLVLYRDTLYGDLASCDTDERYGVHLGRRRFQRLDRLNALIIRKEPPFNIDYLSMTYLLEFLKNKIFIMNDPSGIRKTNEKLSSLNALAYTPKTLTGYRPDLMLRFLARERQKTYVLKPLYGKGGIGVRKLSTRRGLLERELYASTRRSDTPVMVQHFVPHNRGGDKRILILGGRPLGAFTRIPGPNDFRANMAFGAKARAASITAQDRRILHSLKPYLKKNGLEFVGVDVLQGRLTEINVTSPAGVPEINQFDDIRTEENIVAYIERRAS